MTSEEITSIRKKVKAGDVVSVSWKGFMNEDQYKSVLPEGMYKVVKISKNCTYKGNCPTCYGKIVLEGDIPEGRCFVWGNFTPFKILFSTNVVIGGSISAEDFLL